jgi:hypothetical protein
MESQRGAVDVATRPVAAPLDRPVVVPSSVDADATIVVLDRYQRECDLLAGRLHEGHPDVSLARIAALVERASEELAEARVQSFKLILVERSVRRELTVRR